MRDFNVLTDNEPFLDQPIKNKQESYEKLIEMSRNNDYAIGNLINCFYHQKCYRLIRFIKANKYMIFSKN